MVDRGPHSTLLEPPPREDDRCLVCLEPRRPERSLKYAGYVAVLDGFCSTTCCRTFFGCELAATVTGPKRAAA